MTCLSEEEQRRYVARLFTRIAPHYDLMNTIMSLGLLHGWRLRAAEGAAQAPRGCVLDVASGTGEMALALCRRRERVVGIDLLPAMVVRARRKVVGRYATGVNFVVGDALSLPFPEGTFAAVAIAFGLRNLPDASAALDEMVRVLCPGGRLVVLEMVPPQQGPFFARTLLRFHLRYVIPFLGTLLARDQESYAYLDRSSKAFPHPQHLARLMEEAGLVDVSFRLLGLGSVALHQGRKPGAEPSLSEKVPS